MKVSSGALMVCFFLTIYGRLGFALTFAAPFDSIDFGRIISPQSKVPNAKRDCDITDIYQMADGNVSVLAYKVSPKWRIPFISDWSVVGTLSFYDVRFNPETECVVDERRLPTCFSGNITSKLSRYEPRAVWLGDSIVCSYLSRTEGQPLERDLWGRNGVSCRVTQEGAQDIPQVYIIPMGYANRRPALLFPNRNFSSNVEMGLRNELTPDPAYLFQDSRGVQKSIVYDKLVASTQSRELQIRGMVFYGLGEGKNPSQVLFVVEDALEGPGNVWSYDCATGQAEPIKPSIKMTFPPPFVKGNYNGRYGSTTVNALALQPTGTTYRLHYLVHSVSYRNYESFDAYCLRMPDVAHTFRLPKELETVFGNYGCFQRGLFPYKEHVYIFTIGYIAKISPASATCTILYSRWHPSFSYRKDGRVFPLERIQERI